MQQPRGGSRLLGKKRAAGGTRWPTTWPILGGGGWPELEKFSQGPRVLVQASLYLLQCDLKNNVILAVYECKQLL